jgi:hypothetical protein
MFMAPEAHTAILRTTVVAAVALVCIVGAIRTDRRWARILLAVLAVPITLFAMFGLLTISLIIQYGPR